jgi:transglutaminase-like putative cysteine protease
MIYRWTILLLLVLGIGVVVYALPATLSLPPGPRPGLEPLTIPQAADQLRQAGLSGAPLVEAARDMVSERMAYSRRNSFDSPPRAFERGYGYCTQQSRALVELLTRLGFEARVVHAFRNRFPDGTITSHSWVQVQVEGQVRYVDPIFYDAEGAALTFTPLSEVQEISPLLRGFETWGAPAVNAHRFYRTGKDQEW